MKLAVIIPAYSEAEKIVNTVLGVRKALQGLIGYGVDKFEIVVVDDGSKDGTSDLAERAGATVRRHLKNKGKGAAKRTGWDWVIKNGYDWTITLDADGQHSWDDIAKFIQAARETGADMILPQRKFSLQAMGIWRLLANVLQSWLVSIRIGKRIHDSQCDFRLISKEILEKVKTKSRRFEQETEFLILALRHGFSCTEVKVKTIYLDGRKSRISPVIDVIRYLWLLIKSLTWG